MFNFLKKLTSNEHDFCQENLSGYLDRRLTARDRARVEGHLRECAVCRADLESLRQTVALLRAVPVMTPPRSFLLPVPEAARLRQAPRPRMAYVYLQAATAVATVLLVLVVSADAVLRFHTASTAPRGSGSPPPVQVMLAEATVAPVVEHTTVTELGEQRALGAPQEAQTTLEPRPPEQAEVVRTPEASAQPQALLLAGQPSETGDAGATAAAEVGAAAEPEGAPSRTFAKSAAGPPLTPTDGAAVAPAAPLGEEPPSTVPDVEPTTMGVAAETPVPPVHTPVPTLRAPTATAMPAAATPELAAIAMPQADEGPTAEPGKRDERALQPAGRGTMLEAARPVLRWAELVLIPLVALLLAATLLARRRRHSA